MLKQNKKNTPPVCSHSGKEYKDITFSERRNGDFHCGECGSRFYLEEGKPAILPRHTIPEELHMRLKQLEEDGIVKKKRNED